MVGILESLHELLLINANKEILRANLASTFLQKSANGGLYLAKSNLFKLRVNQAGEL